MLKKIFEDIRKKGSFSFEKIIEHYTMSDDEFFEFLKFVQYWLFDKAVELFAFEIQSQHDFYHLKKYSAAASQVYSIHCFDFFYYYHSFLLIFPYS